MIWTSILWTGACCSIVGTLLIGAYGDWTQAVGPGMGAFAATASAAMASKLHRAGVKGFAFVKATTTARVVAGSWTFIFVFLAAGSVLGAVVTGRPFYWLGFLVARFRADLLALVGFGAFMAVIGPGYAEYCDAQSRSSTRTASPTSPPRVSP